MPYSGTSTLASVARLSALSLGLLTGVVTYRFMKASVKPTAAEIKGKAT